LLDSIGLIYKEKAGNHPIVGKNTIKQAKKGRFSKFAAQNPHR
jgi:hypothetical protein